MINTLVSDLIQQSERNIAVRNPATIEDVRSTAAMIAFSPEMNERQHALKSFLHTHLYRHYRVMRMGVKAQRIIRDLFDIFMADSRLLPPQFQPPAGQTEQDRARAVADYIAGMTDRYAIREHRRIFAVEEMPASF
jgi:dGTPase